MAAPSSQTRPRCQDLFDQFSLDLYEKPPSCGFSWSPEELEHGLKIYPSSWLVSQDRSLGVCLWQNLETECEILAIVVSPKLRGRGLGTRLLSGFIRARKRELFSRCVLEVHQGNLPAIRLYSGLGFLEVGLRRSYYPDGGSASVYALDLNSPSYSGSS